MLKLIMKRLNRLSSGLIFPGKTKSAGPERTKLFSDNIDFSSLAVISD